jgi:hypothetical protein
MKKHWLVILLTGSRILKLGATALDLHSASSYILDVFDIGTAGAHNLSSEVKAWNGFQVYWNFLFRPFSLNATSASLKHDSCQLYPSKFIALKLLRFSTAKPTLIHKVREVLLHQFLDLGYGLLKSFLAGARDVKVERRNLVMISNNRARKWIFLTEGVDMLLSG